MRSSVKLLDVVALTEDVPEHGLVCGQVGTVVEELAGGILEVEFSDAEGRTYASTSVRADQMIVLHYQSTKAA